MSELEGKTCIPCEGGVPTLTAKEVAGLLKQVDNNWSANAENTIISRKFQFKGFYKTIAFVNAIAWVAHRQNHHPDLEVTFNSCTVNFTTHAINGLSENDFICAAKVDEVYNNGPL